MERPRSRSPVHSKPGLSPPPHLDAKRAPARNKAQAWLLMLRDNEPSDEADPHITTSDRLERHAHDPRGVARSRRLLPAQGPRLAAREPSGRQFMERYHESFAFGRRITGPSLNSSDRERADSVPCDDLDHAFNVLSHRQIHPASLKIVDRQHVRQEPQENVQSCVVASKSTHPRRLSAKR